MNKTYLSHFQEEALRNIVHEFDNDGDSALVVMPPGAGKTTLAQHFFVMLLIKIVPLK